MSEPPPTPSSSKKAPPPLANKIALGKMDATAAKAKRGKLLSNLTSQTAKHLPDFLPQIPKTDIPKSDYYAANKLNPKQKHALKKRGLQTVKNRNRMEYLETKRVENAIVNADASWILQTESAGLLEPEHEMEKTYKMSQEELCKKHLDENSIRQVYSLQLNQYGPYGVQYSRSGRHSILYGKAGHVALMDCHERSLQTEFYVNETVRDATFLHNQTLFALAQKNHVYIYDDNGAEVHRLETHADPYAVEYLPHHWLLASIGRGGWLRYQDVSTGQIVSSHRTKLGTCGVLKRNPRTAVLHAGHGNGMVTLWSPACKREEYLAKIMAHPGAAITDLAVDLAGRIMVTAGQDSRVKIWDLRMWKSTHEYTSGSPAFPVTSLDISQTNLLAMGCNNEVAVWNKEALLRKVKQPYMYHKSKLSSSANQIQNVQFRPFEDVCGIGSLNGFESIIVPGAGEPNLDSSEIGMNPYESKKQRQENEIKSLLEKLPSDMIALEYEGDDTMVGKMEMSKEVRKEYQIEMEEAANAKKGEKREKRKMRGRGKVGKKLQKKQRNVVEEEKIKHADQLEKRKEKKKESRQGADGGEPQEDAVLSRFYK